MTPLHERMNGHRSKFYEVIEGRVNFDYFDITDDDHSLGIRLIDHGSTHHADFNKVFNSISTLMVFLAHTNIGFHGALCV